MSNLTNPEWIAHEFRKNNLLRNQLRNAIVHACIIEGVVKDTIQYHTFSSAILTLLLRRKIGRLQASLFNDISTDRNTLVHCITDEEKLPDRDSIDNTRNALLENIRKAYSKSQFLEDNLFKKYNIDIRSYIPFEPFDESE